MTHSLRVLCRPSSCAGFALAGVRALPASDANEASGVLRALLAETGPGVVFVEDALYDELPPTLRETLERGAVPVVIPFPAPRLEPRPSVENELVEMLRTAIGHRVRLR